MSYLELLPSNVHAEILSYLVNASPFHLEINDKDGIILRRENGDYFRYNLMWAKYNYEDNTFSNHYPHQIHFSFSGNCKITFTEPNHVLTFDIGISDNQRMFDYCTRQKSTCRMCESPLELTLNGGKITPSDHSGDHKAISDCSHISRYSKVHDSCFANMLKCSFCQSRACCTFTCETCKKIYCKGDYKNCCIKKCQSCEENVCTNDPNVIKYKDQYQCINCQIECNNCHQNAYRSLQCTKCEGFLCESCGKDGICKPCDDKYNYHDCHKCCKKLHIKLLTPCYGCKSYLCDDCGTKSFLGNILCENCIITIPVQLSNPEILAIQSDLHKIKTVDMLGPRCLIL